MEATAVLHKKKVLAPKLRFKGFANSLSVLNLDEIVTFKSGGTPAKDNPSYWGGDIPWISAASMLGKYYSKSERTLTEQGLKNGSKLTSKGSLLLLVRGSMLFNKIPIGIAEIDVAFNQDLKALSAKENSNTEFIYQWLSSRENLLLDKVVGTGLGAGKLDTEDLKNLKVYLPSLPEQQKIASFLSAVDEKIQQLTRKKELLEQYKKGVMQQLFSGKLRFKDENGKAYPDWKEKRLGDVVIDYRLGGNYRNTEETTIYPLIKMGNLDRGKIKIDKIEYIPINEPIDSKDEIKYGDLFFNTRNTLDLVGKVAIWRNELPKAYYNSNLMYLKFENNFFMNYRLNSYEGVKALKRFATGTTSVAAIYTKDLLKLELLIPCIEEQNNIADYLSGLDSKIESVNKQITQTQIFKKGLLQQMFV